MTTITTTPASPSIVPPKSDLSPLLAQRLDEARHAIGSDQPGFAERLLGYALEIAPDDPEAHRLMGIAMLMTGKFSDAVGHLRAALAQQPDDAATHMTLGSALVEIDAVEDGLVHLTRASELMPDSTAVWFNLGVALQFNDNTEPARDAFARAVTLEPGYIKARNKLADVLMNVGDIGAAATMLRNTLNRQPDCVDAWVILGNLKTERLTADDVGQLRGLRGRPGLDVDARARLGFVLAKALEDQAEYASAFAVVSEANVLKRRELHWDREQERARVFAIASAFAGPLPEPVDPALGEEAILVVCLPRSASTLVEQILASHPQVEGGDELQVLEDVLNGESERQGQVFPGWVHAATGADWQRLGKTYLARVHAKCGHALRFTDKSINNWALVGAALAMLPGARVVNSRRDPLETCFACYCQLFPEGCHYTYDLDDMVDYYAGYDRLSALWAQKFPHRYFDHSYELLQSDTEQQIRRLLDFCGLPFDPACLAFHETPRVIRTLSAAQVREPMQHDTARAPLYGAKLDPLRAKLRAAGIPVADG